MIVPDRQRVKSWARRVRAILRANPALSARRPKRLSLWNQRRSWTTLRWFVPLAAGFLGWSTSTPDRLLDFALLWTLCVVFFRAGNWTNALHSADQLAFYFVHPVSDREVFAHQRTLLLRSSVWIGLDWTAMLLGLAIREGSLVHGLLAPLAGVAIWATTLALALLLVRHWPRVPYQLASGFCWIALIITVQLHLTIVPSLITALRAGTPGGWTLLAWEHAHAGAPLGWFGLCVIASGTIATVRLLLRRAEADFSVARVFAFLDGPPVPDNEPAAEPAAPTAPAVSPVTTARLRAEWQGLAARPPGTGHTPKDTVRNFILRLLPFRLRVLADFYRPMGQFRWDRGWLIALGGLLLAQLLRLVGLPMNAVATISALSVAFFAVPLLGGQWPGFTSAHIFQTQIGMQSFAPIGFWETARLILLTNGLRLLVAFPLLFLAGRSGISADATSAAGAFGWAFRIWLLLAAAQPIYVIMHFSRSTNDTSSRWWLTALFLLGIPFGLIVLFAAGVTLFLSVKPLTVLLAGLAPLAVTSLALGAYGFAYHRGWFDLVNRSATPQG